MTQELHYLKSRWTFWFDNADYSSVSGMTGQTIDEVYTFETVEHFWGLQTEIPQAGQLTRGTRMFVLKKGLKPNLIDDECDAKMKFMVDISNADKIFETLVCFLFCFLYSYLFCNYNCCYFLKIEH